MDLAYRTGTYMFVTEDGPESFADPDNFELFDKNTKDTHTMIGLVNKYEKEGQVQIQDHCVYNNVVERARKANVPY